MLDAAARRRSKSNYLINTTLLLVVRVPTVTRQKKTPLGTNANMPHHILR